MAKKKPYLLAKQLPEYTGIDPDWILFHKFLTDMMDLEDMVPDRPVTVLFKRVDLTDEEYEQMLKEQGSG